MSADESDRANEDFLAGLDFGPDWARGEPGSQAHVRMAPGPRDRAPNRDRRDAPRDRKREGTRRAPSGERGFGGRPRDSVPSRPPVRLDPGPRLRIAFLPERRGLGAIVRRIHKSLRAYDLPDVAALFLQKPEYHLLKIETGDPRRGDAAAALYQCALCETLSPSAEKAIEHLLRAHMDDLFEAETVEREPPSGAFPCVGRLKDTGEWIGPPNHHSFAERLQEIQSARYPDRTVDQLRERVEMLRDEESMEAWKQEASRVTTYRWKDQPDAERMTLAEARSALLARKDEWIREHHRFVLPAQAARATEDPGLLAQVRDAWEREKRFPTTMINALRPALRHMKLHLFKTDERSTFVTAVEPAPIDPSLAVSPLRDALHFLHSHPGAKREDLIAGLAPGAEEGDPRVHEVLQSLHWLIEKGHVIAFFDGTLTVPVSKGKAPHTHAPTLHGVLEGKEPEGSKP